MSQPADNHTAPAESARVRLVMSWLLVGIPLAYGISQTLIKAAKLFTG